jgi:hypothetical protein
MEEPINMNRLGNAAQIANGIKGVAWSWNGSATYSAGKFGNGMYTNNTANWLSTASDDGFDPNDFSISMWVRTDWSITNGVPSDATNHAFWEWNKSGQDRIIINTNPADLCFAIKVLNVWYFLPMTTGVTWAAATDTHLGFKYRRAGLSTGNYREFYINGSLITSSAFQPPNQALSGGTFRLGGIAGAWAVDSVIDQSLIFNNEVTDFNFREDERGGLNDQSIIL